MIDIPKTKEPTSSSEWPVWETKICCSNELLVSPDQKHYFPKQNDDILLLWRIQGVPRECLVFIAC